MPAPGASSRGRGGKFKKYTRGGGHHFSRELQPVDADGNLISMWSSNAKKRAENAAAADDDDEDSSSEEEEDEDSDDAGPSGAAAAAAKEMSREDRKAQKKARKAAALKKGHVVEVGDMPSSDEDSEEDGDLPANPNHSKAARQQAIAPVAGSDDEEGEGGVDGVTDGVAKMKMPASRREREAMEAQIAKQKYMKLHAAGKTDEAKADLARLKAIREQREAEAARRQVEKEERDEQEKKRREEVDVREAKRREAAAGPKKGKKK